MDEKYLKEFNVEAQVVNGTCPHCTEESVFVSIYKTIYRCVTCGTDLEQKINGKISYIPHVNSAKDIKLDFTNTNG